VADQQDRIYVFNRGAKPVMVFNTDGKLIASGGDQELNGKKLDPNWQHSGAVDWEGNIYMIERDAHRIVGQDGQVPDAARDHERRQRCDTSIRRPASPC
jgi:hypothetical protein